MRRIVQSFQSRIDLLEIEEFIGRENPARSVTFVTELREAIARIPHFPFAYPRRDDLRPGIRMAVHEPYVILFRAGTTDIRILRVIHGARDLRGLFRKP